MSRHKINENVKISIVGPFQLSVIVRKCYARGFERAHYGNLAHFLLDFVIRLNISLSK